MNFVFFYHSWSSCWNHGNAHFLRGVVRELLGMNHRVRVCEPAEGWSRSNALQERDGAAALAEAERLVPGVDLRRCDGAQRDLDRALDGADVVIVHEWNEPALVAALGRRRAAGGRFLLLFHDTHHRAVTAPDEIGRFVLDDYDAILAFGEVLREVYLARGWGRRAFTWHEAADTALFKPARDVRKQHDLVWIGNWGDEERSRELHEYLIEPVAQLSLSACVHGVRYPEHALQMLATSNIAYGGWLPNHRAPAALAGARMTVHVPRRPYVEALPGIPTIRVFEALACGIPLVSAPWDDAERLFPPGCYLTARDGTEMARSLALILNDRDVATELSRSGLQAIHARHTCADRVTQLLAIVDSLRHTPEPRHTAPAEGQLGRPA